MVIESIFALFFITVSTINDCRTSKIKNKITFPAILIGLILSIFNSNSIVQILICIVLYFFFLFFIPKKFNINEFIGAGDIKVYILITAFMGVKFSIYTFIYSIFVGTAVVVLLNKERFKEIFFNIFCFFHIKETRDFTKENIDSKSKNNFALFIFIGFTITYIQLFYLNNNWLLENFKNII